MIGRTCGQYRILDKLGEGSMGVVYKAEHVRLKHLVALKFLRPELLADASRRQRFLREAEVAASLDSPAICSVIDYGEAENDSVFLVMRYCEGMTLRDKLRTGPLPVDQAIRYAVQLGEGLQAAHSHGVIHRDIKPSNIIITSQEDDSGSTLPVGPDAADETIDMPRMIEQAKITDFGLAYLPEATRLTAAGAQLGTPAYMSPEQVDGREPDQRSDIWSLGVVLYEMTTGQLPFGSSPPQAVMHAVTSKDPLPVEALQPDLPAEVGWITGKALRKDPAKRYQHIGEMTRDLRLLQQKLAEDKPRDLGSWVLESRGRLLVGGGGLFAVAAVMVTLAILPVARSSRGPVLGTPRQLTSEMGRESEPAVSPDGSRIAFAGDTGNNEDIYIVGVRGGNALRLTTDPARDSAPAWDPDGSTIYFESNRKGMRGIWKIGAFGGDPTLVIAGAADPAISPDGKRIAFSRADANGGKRIFVAALDRPDRDQQLTAADDGTFDHTDPAWSPDGRRICYATYDDLWTVPARGGTAVRLTTGGVADMSPTWSPDGRHVYFASLRDNTLALWRVAAGGGAPERLTPGSGPEGSPSLAPNGRLLAYSTDARMVNDDVVIHSRSTGKRHRIGGQEHIYHPCLNPAGTMICYVSDRWDGRRELCLQELEEGQPTGLPHRLTDQPGAAAQPQFSPDGRWLAYYRINGSKRSVWIAATDGTGAFPFTDSGCRDMQPAWSPDGRRLAFTSECDSVVAVYIAPVDQGRRTGPPVLLTPPGTTGWSPTWSPDGTQIAAGTTIDGRDLIAILAADGSGEIRRLDPGFPLHFIQWDHHSGRLLMSVSRGDSLALLTLDPRTGDSAELSPPFRFNTHTAFAYFHTDARGDLIAHVAPSLRGDIWIQEPAGASF